MLRRIQEALSQDKEILAGTKADPAGLQREGLGELLNAKPREIKSFLSGQLAPGPDPGVAE
jgi:hypothetical protein